MPRGKSKNPILSWPRALFVLIFICAIFAGEWGVRATDADWHYVESSLYYNHMDSPANMPDPDPDMLYRPRPGVHYVEGRTVRINSLGVRGPERPAQKPPGVRRIVIVGGSNVYGSPLPYEETWPARLEVLLNQGSSEPFEVWNLGAAAYVGVQMAKRGDEALAQLAPDLLIVALGNQGMRPFLDGTDVRPYFEKYHGLWFEMVIWPGFDLLPDSLQHSLISRSHLYRQLLIVMTRKFGLRSINRPHHEVKNAKAIRELLLKAKHRTRVCVFCYPGVKPEYFQGYLRDTDVPVIALRADGLSKDYEGSHPPAYVMEWYAQQLAPRVRALFEHKEGASVAERAAL